MPDITSPSRTLRLAALLASAALALTACGGGSSNTATTSSSSSSSSGTPTPSTTVAVPSSVTITAPGTKLAFGKTATVTHEAGKQGTVLGLRVDSAKQGSINDFQGFNLDDPYKRRGSYYYVRVTVSNKGKGRLGGIQVPLWGISGNKTLLQAVQFTSSFKKCPSQNLPRTFKPGDRFRTCLVYLSPNHGKLVGVSYRPTAAFVPIEWHGTVKVLAKPKKHGSKKAQHKKHG